MIPFSLYIRTRMKENAVICHIDSQTLDSIKSACSLVAKLGYGICPH